jgi:hypothetical protein
MRIGAPLCAPALHGAVKLKAEVRMFRLFLVTSLFLAVAIPSTAQFVAPGGAIPVVAYLPGENDTFWRSDVSVFNLSSSETEVTLYLFPELKNSGPSFDFQSVGPFSIPGNGQLTLKSVVSSEFDLRNKKGGLQVFSDGAPLALASRTYTFDPQGGGSYGLNVYGAPVFSQRAWLANVEHDGFFRTNIGIFLPAGPPPGQSFIFTVTVRSNDGTEIASGSLDFDQAGLMQKSLSFFGVENDLLDGSVTIDCSEPATIWYAYATVVDNASGDSVYRAAIGDDPEAR